MIASGRSTETSGQRNRPPVRHRVVAPVKTRRALPFLIPCMGSAPKSVQASKASIPSPAEAGSKIQGHGLLMRLIGGRSLGMQITADPASSARERAPRSTGAPS